MIVKDYEIVRININILKKETIGHYNVFIRIGNYDSLYDRNQSIFLKR